MSSINKQTTASHRSVFDEADRTSWSGQTHTRRRRFRRLISLSSHTTYWLGRWFPRTFPLIYVLGYPKSGTSWAGQMIADYLRLPFPQHSLLPISFAAVFQGHQSIDKKLPNGVYVVRDGRDVLVSSFFHLKSQYAAQGGSRAHRRFFQSVDLSQPLRNLLPMFIDHLVRHPVACRYHWGDHVTSYFDSENSNVHLLRYEDLLEQPVAALQKLMRQLQSGEPSIQRIEETVRRFAFSRQAKTDSGDSYLRKGKRGDWMNYFDQESAELFCEYFGKALIQAGYEQDNLWPKRIA